MLPHQKRIRTRGEYYHIFRGRTSVRGQYLILQGLPNALGHHRFGFIVSTAVAKKATTRNKIKRQLRHLAQTVTSNGNHWDIVARVHRGPGKLPTSVVTKEFLPLFQKITHAPTRRSPHYTLPKNNFSRPRPVSS